ncbi:uncharacterized protein [Antedon mediterranea]|uniref:uncharacterized protein n=1 Tax=Antedon mediterranea TaxID=105859 RepID=UPI003AF79310
MFDGIIIAEYIKINFMDFEGAVLLKIGLLVCKGINFVSFECAHSANLPLTIQSENVVSESNISTNIQYDERITGFRIMNQNPIAWGSSKILIATEVFSGVNSSIELFIDGVNYTQITETHYQVEQTVVYSLTMATEMFNELDLLNVTMIRSNVLSLAKDYILLSVEYKIDDLKLYVPEFAYRGHPFQIEFDMSRGSHVVCNVQLNDTTKKEFSIYLMLRSDGDKISFTHQINSLGEYDIFLHCWNNISVMNVSETISVQNNITDELQLNCDDVVAIDFQEPWNITVEYSFTGIPINLPNAVFANYTVIGRLSASETIMNMVGIEYDENLSASHTINLSTYGTYDISVYLYNKISNVLRTCTVDLEAVITSLNVNAEYYAPVKESVTFDISVTWGSRIQYTIDFGDDEKVTKEQTSEYRISVPHSFGDKGVFNVTVNATNSIGETSTFANVTVQYPVKAYELKCQYLNKLGINEEGEPSHVVIPIDVYRNDIFKEPTDAYFTIDFDDGSALCPMEEMCLLADVSEHGVVETSKNTNNMLHVVKVNNEYSTSNSYTINLTIWNHVSNVVFQCDMLVLEGIEQLKQTVQYSDVYIDSQNATNTTDELLEEEYVALGNWVVVTTTIGAGSHVQYTWDFGDSTAVKTTNEHTEIHQYSEPGSYIISVNASNPVSSEVASKQIYVQEVVTDLRLTGSDAVLVNSTVDFILELGRVATDACYRIDFISELSEPERVRFHGSHAMCEEKYADFQDVEPIDSLQLWFDVNNDNADSTIKISNTFYEYGRFEIQYEGVNTVSYVNKTVAQLITKYPCYLPIVDVSGVNECGDTYTKCNQDLNIRQYEASKRIKVESAVTVNCSSTDLTLYEWKGFIKEGNDENQIPVDLSSHTVTTGSGLGTLIIEPKKLTYGIYRFELRVTMLGGEIGVYSEDSVNIEVIPTNLSVEVVGGEYHTISWTKGTFDLDGLTLTHDPDIDEHDKTGMNFTWLCRRARKKFLNESIHVDELETFEEWDDDFEVLLRNSTVKDRDLYYQENIEDVGGCFGKLGGLDVPKPGGKLSYQAANLTLNTSAMYWLMEYEVKFVVRKGDRRKEYIQILNVVEGEPPEIQMACKLNCKKKKTSTNRSSLETKELNKRRGTTLYYKWEVSYLASGSYQPILERKVNLYSGTGTNVSNLSIEPGLFEENQQIRIQLREYHILVLKSTMYQ